MIALAIALVTLTAAAIAETIYLIARCAKAEDRERAARDAKDSALDELRSKGDALIAQKNYAVNLDQALTAVKEELEREKAATLVAETQRDRLLDSVSRAGPPGAVALAIRDELSKLSGPKAAGGPATASGASPGLVLVPDPPKTR